MNQIKRGQLPDFTFEQQLWQTGYQRVIGIDEVGRGALAGPVVVSVVCFAPNHQPIAGVRDSKQLAANQRTKLAQLIKQHAFFWQVGQATATEIDTLGIVPATMTAIVRALVPLTDTLPEKNSHLLMDGKPFAAHHTLEVPHWPTLPITYIVKGDQKSYSIAAASIVAKVFRDELMTQAATQFPPFNWAQNKGYGTLLHRQAITTTGACDWHRKSFLT